MEISPVPRRPSARDRRRLLIGVLVLVPLLLLVLLPAVLGLDRYVVTDSSMGHSMQRGDIVLARDVPTSDLKPGDVITFRPPVDVGRASREGSMTHRIVSIHDGIAVTRGDGAGTDDAWRLRLDAATYPRVVMHVPWVGYPFVAGGGWMSLAGASALALALGLAAAAPRRRPVRVRWTPSHRPVTRVPAG